MYIWPYSFNIKQERQSINSMDNKQQNQQREEEDKGSSPSIGLPTNLPIGVIYNRSGKPGSDLWWDRMTIGMWKHAGASVETCIQRAYKKNYKKNI